jgi:8-oxo-dGTP pyrophosphatase MutT (NUDIX family)
MLYFMNWKILDSQYLFKETWFTVRRDRCERPDGKIVDPYYVFEFPDWVVAVPVTNDGKIVLVKQYRHAMGETIWEIPGGCIDATDATREGAARREALEETGYAFEKAKYLGKVSANPSTNSNMTYMYLLTGGEKQKDQELDHNEDIEVCLFTVDEVKQLIRDNQFYQSLHVSALLYALNKMGQLSY